ncbi:MAG: hypothetical protein J6A01_03650 [Proteobacteria bacterium]|nr:hypothetical protein [Pseudomonadota bacterium]
MYNKLTMISLGVLIAACVLPACGKKDAGCKLDSECPNGQICRNMKCEAAPAANEGQKEQAAENTDAAKDNADAAKENADAPKDDAAKPEAKPTTPQQIDLASYGDNKNIKLEDLGLDIDYILTDSINLHDNTKLEIAPGVTIDMQSSSAGFDINDDAALIVKGTADAPVIFKSTNSSVWSGLRFSSKNKDNALNYLQIQNADGEEHVIGLDFESRIAMDHVTLDGSANDGIRVGGDAKFTKFTNNTIKNCKGYPLVLDSYAHLGMIGDGNQYENNKQFIRINPYTFDNVQEAVIKKQPIPYLLADGMNVDGESGALTIEPGVEFVFEHEKEAHIAGSIQLKLEGTAENPVIMRGMTDEPNFWRGLIIDSTRPISISGLVLSQTGNGEEPSLNIRSEANITLSNIVFKSTEHRCMEIAGGAKVINKGGLTFEKCGKGNIFDNRIEGDDDKKVIADLPVAAAE